MQQKLHAGAVRRARSRRTSRSSNGTTSSQSRPAKRRPAAVTSKSANQGILDSIRASAPSSSSSSGRHPPSPQPYLYQQPQKQHSSSWIGPVGCWEDHCSVPRVNLQWVVHQHLPAVDSRVALRIVPVMTRPKRPCVHPAGRGSAAFYLSGPVTDDTEWTNRVARQHGSGRAVKLCEAPKGLEGLARDELIADTQQWSRYTYTDEGIA
jgi:hypothetical protein